MKKVRWGILGTGYIANKFAIGLQSSPNSELVAIGSRDYAKAQHFANEFHVPSVCGSYEDVARHSEVDVVYVATPHNLHYENTIMCLNYGKHVLCEKPFAVNGREVREMIDCAKKNNRFLMEALWSRFLPNIIKAKEIIDSGKIGEVKLLRTDFCMKANYNLEGRLFNRDLIGGSLLDIGIYPVFLALYLFGVPPSYQSQAIIGETGVDYSFAANFKYNDQLAVLNSSFMVKSDTTAEIYGSYGRIVFDPWWFCPVPIKIVYNDGFVEEVPLQFVSNGYNYEADEVARCILEGKTQSEAMSWDFSLQLIDLLDQLRAQCGIVYPNHDR